MSNSVQVIPLANLLIALLLACSVMLIYFRWSLQAGNILYALLRMLIQLLLVGYILSYIFAFDHLAIVMLVLIVMVLAASWIALGSLKAKRLILYKYALAAVIMGGGLSLLVTTQGVLNLQPWYLSQFMIPLAGMVFASSMNSISLAAERLQAELNRGLTYTEARNIAFQTALIPVINSLFAVGLVSLPGMMTGQVLSGVSPLIAVRYQIMVMCMLLASAGISAACFLVWSKSVFSANKA